MKFKTIYFIMFQQNNNIIKQVTWRLWLDRKDDD